MSLTTFDGRKMKTLLIFAIVVSMQFMIVIYVYVSPKVLHKNVRFERDNQANAKLTNETITELMDQDKTPKFYHQTNGIAKGNRVHLYSNEEHKFLFCFIQKNANTLYRNLWFAVERNDPFIYHIDTRKNKSDPSAPFHDHMRIYSLNQNEIFNVKYKLYIDRLTDPKWIKIVVIRDPLERLLSGYLDRCLMMLSKYNISRECVGDLRKKFSFEHFVEAIINKTKNKDYITNPHYWPQSWFCRLTQHLSEYQYVIRYDYNLIGNDTLNLLHSIGLSKYYFHWGLHFNQTMFQDQVHVTYGGGNGVQSKIEFYKQYYTKSLAIKCLNLYKDDYDVFNQYLSYPQWLKWL